MARRGKILLTIFILFLGSLTAVGTAIYTSLQNKIEKRLEKGWVLPPLELYSQGFVLSRGRHFPQIEIEAEFAHRGLSRERDYVFGPAASCTTHAAVTAKDPTQNCLWVKSGEDGSLTVTWDQQGKVSELWQGTPAMEVQEAALFPRLITRFFDGQPVLQKNTALSEIPLACLQAVTAIEDREFLEHSGVSATGTARALLRNLRAGRWAEGGSTITQQLVKNFFLTSKKTLRRKVEEQLLALMLESQLSKDQILEMYLNVIYMGQSGPYQVRGFGSAAETYFDRPIAELSLPECALLAALINNPGRYSPLAHADQAKARRNLVLQKMLGEKMLSDTEASQASQQALPTASNGEPRAHAPYFVMSALKEFSDLGLEAEEGARLYTTLDADLQNLLTAAVARQLPSVEAKIRHSSHAGPLQAAGVSVDVDSGQILASTGGRDFRSSQFNRASESRRQIGSIVKPFVYWSALKTHDPLTPVSDSSFDWKVGRQTWRPKNFEHEAFGTVPYFFALAHSLNVPAARVGQEVGLNAVVKTLKAAGVRDEIAENPSLTLGALELSPVTVAQAYLTLARFGRGEDIHSLRRVENLKGEVLYAFKSSSEFQLEPVPTAVLVGMLEQSLVQGTARSARGLGANFAGKTGTTSDSKDAWFAGFSPRILTVIWVGYDDNTPMNLTGAQAALPLWIEFTRGAQALYNDTPFAWPEGVEMRSFSRDELLEKFPEARDFAPTTDLVFAQ